MNLGPIAIVGTGPSLKKTVGELAQFQTIMTCSKAHDFLVKQGIIPTYHVDVDPGEHKPLNVTPVRGVKYFLHYAVHPTYFDKMTGMDLTVISNRGVQVGDTALQLAYDLGYREIHCFGYDACGRAHERIEFDGQVYYTNSNLLGSIVCFENTCRSLPGVKISVHGRSLLRAYLDRKYTIRVSQPADCDPVAPGKDDDGERHRDASPPELRNEQQH